MPVSVRKAKERDAQNNGSNAGSSGLSPSDVELEEAKISAKLETLVALTQNPGLVDANVIQDAAPNRHPARCKLDRPKVGGNPASSENMSLSPSKLGSGSKKRTRNPTKAGVKSLEPRSRKNNIRRRPREECRCLNLRPERACFREASYTGDTNSKVSVRPLSQRQIRLAAVNLNHTSPPHRMVPAKPRQNAQVSFAMRCVPQQLKKYNAREQRLQQTDNASTSSNNSNIMMIWPRIISQPPSWASSISNLGFRDSPKDLSMNSMSDGEDNLIHGITPLVRWTSMSRLASPNPQWVYYEVDFRACTYQTL